jgi:hypothetical protein
MYVHFPTGGRFDSSQKLLEVAHPSDYERSSEKGICSISLFKYYERLSFYSENTHSRTKNQKFVRNEDWKTACTVAEKVIKRREGLHLDPKQVYIDHGKVGQWPKKMEWMRAGVSV